MKRKLTEPDENGRDRRVETGRHHEEHPVLELEVRRVGNDTIADDGEGEEGEHDRTANLVLVRDVGGADSKEGSDGVGRDRVELGIDGAVSETLDNGGDEEAERVEGAEDGKVSDSREPGLDGEDGLSDAPP